MRKLRGKQTLWGQNKPANKESWEREQLEAWETNGGPTQTSSWLFISLILFVHRAKQQHLNKAPSTGGDRMTKILISFSFFISDLKYIDISLNIKETCILSCSGVLGECWFLNKQTKLKLAVMQRLRCDSTRTECKAARILKRGNINMHTWGPAATELVKNTLNVIRENKNHQVLPSPANKGDSNELWEKYCVVLFEINKNSADNLVLEFLWNVNILLLFKLSCRTGSGFINARHKQEQKKKLLKTANISM